jgi:glycosyltransferase involved in cell wall biosynthesis
VGESEADAASVAVVVPTRDRPAVLARCLRALSSQRDVDLEIVVVDDGSTRADAVAAVVARAQNARLVRLEGAGPAAARNAGADVARAPYVLFTDDDCVPADDWASALAGALAAGSAAAGGRTVASSSAGVLARSTQAVSDALEVETRVSASRPTFAASGNFGATRETLREVRFDESFPRPGGEDRAFCVSLARAGRDVSYVADAVVMHDPDMTLRSFVSQHFRYGRGAFRVRFLERTEPRLERFTFYAALLRSGFRVGAAEGIGVAVAQLATALGFVTEATTTLAARARRPAPL